MTTLSLETGGLAPAVGSLTRPQLLSERVRLFVSHLRTRFVGPRVFHHRANDTASERRVNPVAFNACQGPNARSPCYALPHCLAPGFAL
eukprot:scaffold13821_cov68-Phaeocystis_antarctica.AAC.3